MSLHSARRPSWRYTLLDAEDRPLGRLLGVSGGRCEVVAASRLGGSAQLTIDDRGQTIDWMSHRVQIIYDPGIAGADPWPVGVFLFTSPSTVRRDDRVTHSVDLLPKMVVPDEDTVEERFSLAAGTPIIATVVALLESTGETQIAATTSPATLTSGMVWEAGESKLTIINNLLDAAGYWALWCDGSGQYRVEPYVPPLERPLSWRFAAGEAAIHEPGWSREQDLANVPNRYVVTGSGSDDTPALSAVATNEDPESPYSYQARGRWITRTETGAEGSQAVLNLLAQRRLTDAMGPVAKLSVTHAVLPLDPNALVEFRPHGHEALATVQRMSYELTFNGQCRAEWRET